MRSIRLMSKSLSEKIAAGEVVERPGSIVKELCENSIDAGSTAVTVEIKQGGISYIRITDNGSGIAADEVELAFMRHSTSKMYSEEELFNIESLGFRGEALASIAAVSQLRMTTRVRQADSGMLAELSGGEITLLQETGCPYGTSITVTNLFFNTPARRKFLKKPAQEAAYIGDIVSRLILSHPAISFRLIQDGRTVLHSPGDNILKNAVMSVYGAETAERMLPVEYTEGDIRIYGLTGSTELEKNNKSYQSFFVNGRYIKEKMVSAAVQNGYVNNITIGKFPMFVLFMQLPAAMVDVNVHPNKLEVRFWSDDEAADIICRAVKQALSAGTEVPALAQPDQSGAGVEDISWLVTKSDGLLRSTAEKGKAITDEDAASAVTGSGNTAASTAVYSGAGKTECLADRRQTTQEDNGQTEGFESSRDERYRQSVTGALRAGEYSPVIRVAESRVPAWHTADAKTSEPFEAPVQISVLLQDDAEAPRGFDDYRVVGQMFATYIIVESGDTVYLIDQHAAHERLLYERLVRSMETGDTLSQTLLAPQVLSLNYSEREKLLGILPELEALGFEMEPFGDAEFLIRSVPVLMDRPCGAELINEIISDYDTLKNCRAADLRRQRLMQMACKHAVKAGDMLSDEEIEELMRLIKEERVPLTCPHGRPILVCLTKKELELRFKRIQS